jgi:hypothetical protein
MRRVVLVLVVGGLGLAAPGVALAVPAGTISTVAGNPLASGPATAIGQEPVEVAAGPGGVLYIADAAASTIREVNAAGAETTVAGNGTIGYSGDGAPGTSAQLNGPFGVAVDSEGDLLIADSENQRVRLVAGSSCSTGCPFGLASMTKGYIYTVAGSGTAGYSGDGGPATRAKLFGPEGVAVDGEGDLLIADAHGDRVRLVAGSSCSTGCPFGLASMTEGDIYTVAGNGSFGYSGDGGPATSAWLDYPDGLAVDRDGDLLIADTGNRVVRLVAGSSCSTGCPFGLASMTEGDIYTVAGNGSFGYSGDGGPATRAKLGYLDGVAVDSAGDLLIADTDDNRVRLVAGSSCSTGCPFGLASMTDGDIYTIAGDGYSTYSGDGGPGTSAQLDGPYAVAVDSEGDLLIADTGNDRVRLVAASSCSTGCPFGLATMTRGDVYTIAGNGSYGYSGDGGPASSAGLADPEGVAVDSTGDLLIADMGDNRVRLVAASSCSAGCPYGLASMTKGDIYTVAGTGTPGYSGDTGSAASARLDEPGDVAVDRAGDLLIADTFNSRVRLVAASSCSASCPYGLAAMTKGNIYTVAGNGTYGYSGDGGSATSAELDYPRGLAADGNGDLLIADTYNDRVRLVAASSCSTGCPFGLASMTKGDIYTVGGTGTAGYSGDGRPATSAWLDLPNGVAVDAAGDLLIADTGNGRVRLVAASSCSTGCSYGLASMTNGDIYTVAGTGAAGYSGDGGPATSAELDYPHGVAVDAGGDLLIADTESGRVREVTGGPVSLSVSLAGPGSGTVSGGGLSCPGTCSTVVAAGTVVTLTATPTAGSTFAGWSGGGCTGTGSCQVTITAATAVTATFSGGYASLVESTPGLVGYWPLGDRSGTVATDVFGAHDGTYLGGVTLGVPGPIFGSSTTAVGLDGVSGHVQLPALGSFSAWTVDGWTDLSAGASGDNCLYCGRDGVRLIVLPAGFYADDLTTGAKLGVLHGADASNVGGWVYWALVRSGQTLTLYRNGVQVGSSSLGSEGASELNGTIGAYSASYFLNGDVGQVAVYSSALSASAVELRFEAGVGAPAGSSASGAG